MLSNRVILYVDARLGAIAINTFKLILSSALLLASGTHSLAATDAAPAPKQRPNILLLIVDDLAPVGTAFGGPVTLPALAALAQRGVSFNRNFANVPVCGASRASMLSGLAPSADRFLTFDSRLDEDAPDIVSLPAFFRGHGWHTVANGKIFDVIADSAAGWSEPVWSPDAQWYGTEVDHRGEHLQTAYIEETRSARLPYAERLAVDDDAYPDGQVASKAVRDLERLAARDTPFFLAVGFRKPHLPFNAPDRYWRVGEGSARLPATWEGSAANIPLKFAGHRSPELRRQYDALPLFGEPDSERAAQIVAAYHAAARYADAQVGRVVQALADSGAANNTVVALMGDHGFLLGQHKLWTKHSLFEAALRTPLVIVDPRGSRRGTVNVVTDLLDVYPTLAELAGLTPPAHLSGESLKPLLDDPTRTERPEKTVSVSRWQNGESIRDQRYRYSRWFDADNVTQAEMLFDLENDPAEAVNLVDEADSKPLVDSLRTRLHASRSGPAWSEALGVSVSRWNLLSSPFGGVLLAATVYPLLTLLLAVVLVALALFISWRLWRAFKR